MLLRSFTTILSRMSWDVHVRNKAFSRFLEALLEHDDTYLDVGCGDNRLVQALNRHRGIGLDIFASENLFRKDRFVNGSIFSLPFQDRAFSFAGSLDVLEHLETSARESAIKELVRVSEKGIVLGFPYLGKPQEIDLAFQTALQRRQKEIPEWLEEHMRQDYPSIECVIDLIRRELRNRREAAVGVSVGYCEPLFITKILRFAAVRSSILYMSLNCVATFVWPIVRITSSEQGQYRALLLVDFRGPGKGHQ